MFIYVFGGQWRKNGWIDLINVNGGGLGTIFVWYTYGLYYVYISYILISYFVIKLEFKVLF